MTKNHRNYRIIKHTEKIEGINEPNERVGLHEMHYKNGEIFAWSEKPSIVGNDIDDLIGSLKLMIEDTERCKSNEKLVYTQNKLQKIIQDK